jgi:hypothetical protein
VDYGLLSSTRASFGKLTSRRLILRPGRIVRP